MAELRRNERRGSMSISIETNVQISATLTLSEGQLRALDALAGYGDEAFLRAFYIKLGKSYMQPFERDLRELFALIRSQVPSALTGIEQSRKALGLPASSGKWVKKGGTA